MFESRGADGGMRKDKAHFTARSVFALCAKCYGHILGSKSAISVSPVGHPWKYCIVQDGTLKFLRFFNQKFLVLKST